MCWVVWNPKNKKINKIHFIHNGVYLHLPQTDRQAKYYMDSALTEVYRRWRESWKVVESKRDGPKQGLHDYLSFPKTDLIQLIVMKGKVALSEEKSIGFQLHTSHGNLKLGFPSIQGLHWVNITWLWHQPWVAITSRPLHSKAKVKSPGESPHPLLPLPKSESGPCLDHSDLQNSYTGQKKLGRLMVVCSPNRSLQLIPLWKYKSILHPKFKNSGAVGVGGRREEVKLKKKEMVAETVLSLITKQGKSKQTKRKEKKKLICIEKTPTKPKHLFICKTKLRCNFTYLFSCPS